MRCPVCSRSDLGVFLELEQVPVLCNQLLPTRERALAAPRGRIDLGFCETCDAICNVAFDEEQIDYSQAYENSLHFSPRFQEYAESLVSRLVDRFGLRGKDIVEIGCGKGDFLRMICDAGGNRGVGFDRSFEEEGDDPASRPFRVVRDHYSEKYADVGADLICCRHVLEHIPQPVGFLDSVRKAAGRQADAAVFFEVPNAMFTLRDLGIWDIIYEHCHYYSSRSLDRLFGDAGFSVTDIYDAYGGQFLCIEAETSETKSRTDSTQRDHPSVAGLVEDFARHHAEKVSFWDQRLTDLLEDGERIAVWGAGSKGVTFLCTLARGGDVSSVVDINPRKHGRHVPLTGQQVVSPAELTRVGIDRVLIMNSIYENEIRGILAEQGSKAIVEVV